VSSNSNGLTLSRGHRTGESSTCRDGDAVAVDCTGELCGLWLLPRSWLPARVPQLENLDSQLFLGDRVVQMELNRRQEDSPQTGYARVRDPFTGSWERCASEKSPLELRREKR
jgi:hypothetical protein